MARSAPAPLTLPAHLSAELERGAIALGAVPARELEAAGARLMELGSQDGGAVDLADATPEAFELIATMMAHPLSAGSWQLDTPWSPPEERQLNLSRCEDGSPVLLIGASGSRWRFTLQRPETAAAAWTEAIFPARTPGGGASAHGRGVSAVLALMWAGGRFERQPRREKLLIMRPTGDAPDVIATHERNWGHRRTGGDTIAPAQLTGRMLESLLRPFDAGR